MKTTKLFLLGIAVFCITSCQQYKKGEGGMLYLIHKDEDGPTLKENDFIHIKAIQKTESDTVMYSSYDFDQPTFLPMQKSAWKGDLYSALSLLSEGDSATFKMPIDSLKKHDPNTAAVTGKYLLFTFKIEKVIPKGKLSDQDFNTQVQAYIAKVRDKMRTGEAGKIAAYIKKKGLTTQTTSSGLYYAIDQKGNGPVAVAGDTVLADYTGHFLTDKMFDSSIADSAKKAKATFNPMRKYEPVKFAVGVGMSIPGMDEALMLFPKGTKAKVIIPSKLAYGEQGNQGIPPFASLEFEVNVVNVIKGKPPVAPTAPVVAPVTKK